MNDIQSAERAMNTATNEKEFAEALVAYVRAYDRPMWERKIEAAREDERRRLIEAVKAGAI